MRHVLLLLIAFFSLEVLAVTNAELGNKDPDLYDIMDGWRARKLRKKREKYEAEGMSKTEADKKIEQDKLEAKKELEEQKTFFVGFPFVAYNPYTSVLVGVGANVSTFLGDKTDTNLSSFNIVGAYTANNQTSLRVINQTYTAHNQWFITGYAQWSDAPGNTYGLGGDTTNSDEFSLERGFFKVNESILYNVSGKFYVGPQFTVDRRYKLYPSDDIPDDLDDNQAAYDELLSRQWYSYEYGTDGQPYLVLGGGVTALYDSRDNVNSPYKGRYANVNYQYFGGDYQFHLINLEYIDYFQIPNKRNI